MDILIVEDDAEIAELIRSTLDREGFQTHVSRDGLGAIATFARLHYGRAAGLAQQWLFAERNNGSPIRYENFQIPSHVDSAK